MNKLFLITNILIFYLFLAPTGALEEGMCLCLCLYAQNDYKSKYSKKSRGF